MTKKPRYNRDGLPIDKNDWTAEDWADLHRAIQEAIKSIAARHEPKAAEESNPERRRGKGRKL